MTRSSNSISDAIGNVTTNGEAGTGAYSYGTRLPTGYWGSSYYVDYQPYGLAPPPQGYRWNRVGNDVYLTVTIPAQNIDASTPADISRIDVFAVTSLTPPPRARIFEIATRVASLGVQPVPRPGQADTGAAPHEHSLSTGHPPQIMQASFTPPPASRAGRRGRCRRPRGW